MTQYKENLIFQVLCNHSVIFEEIAKKLEEDENYSNFVEIRASIVAVHTIYFTFFDYDDSENLEKQYFSYVNEEYRLFNLFYKEDNNQF